MPSTPTTALQSLLRGIVDYAGLFPPAGLDMARSVANYHGYRRDPAAWMLGRFVVAAKDLGALDQAVAELDGALAEPDAALDAPWPLSVVLGPDFDGAMERIESFFSGTAQRFELAAVELSASSVAELEQRLQRTGPDYERYVEVDLREDPREILAAIARAKAFAKARTGALVESGIPSASQLARFLARCAELGLPFKATAGLHHSHRAQQALSYEPDSPRAVMHGFLNVFVCAALLRAGLVNETEAAAVLDDQSMQAFRFDEEGVSWRDLKVDTAELAAIRSGFALSFGSCSFEEPLEDLSKAELL